MVMIARDEARCIGRALASVRGHVERMIVLDTGSSDDTAAIAAAAGAQVGHLDWPDDFAAARNAALDLSDADWNLILDADEWLQGDAADLGPGVLGSEIFLGQVQVASAVDVGGTPGEARTWISRILPRGVRYEGAIHEQPVCGLPVRRLGLTFGHDGYLPDALARKGARNETLLDAGIAARPDDGYLWSQLGREHQARGRAAEAARCFAEALRLTAADAAWRRVLVVRSLNAFKDAGRIEEALRLVDAEFPNWPDSPDFFFAMGDLYLEVAAREPEKALTDHLPLVEYAWRRCLDIGERGDQDGAVTGRGGHMAAHNLAVLYEGLGRAELAAQYTAMASRLKSE
jgi:glycosyltransferase involved in cell wall biosynthesis